MESQIQKTITYFSHFSYAPTLDEIYMFFPVKISKQLLTEHIEKLIKQKNIRAFGSAKRLHYLNNTNKHTHKEYITVSNNIRKKRRVTLRKIRSIQTYIHILKRFSSIQLIGLSGTCAMMNAEKDDDIDFFIITSRNRLWTGRFVALLLAQIMGLRRKRGVAKAPNKVCLNLFFDEANLRVPKRKQNSFTAREILQMKPLINKNQIYEQFLNANSWIYRFFPNTEKMGTVSNIIYSNYKSSLSKNIEILLKTLQLFYIRKHKTTEYISHSQLWFFPEKVKQKPVELHRAPEIRTRRIC